jgi:hypothetical protein
MRSSVIAIVLCLSAAAANAQCAAPASVAGNARTGPELIRTSSAATHTKTSTDQTPTDQNLPADDGLPGLQEATPAPKTDDKQHRHAGPAMMLAAVAVMSGIALRRFSARA